MPEGPEVKLISEYLNNYFKNTTIISIIFIKGRYTKNLPIGYKTFTLNLPLSVTRVKTKGKFIYFLLENNISIWNTLGMSGDWSKKKIKHSKVCFETDKGKIYFVDQRNFGTFKFCFNIECLTKKLNDIGPDMLSDNISLKIFIERINIKRNKNKKIGVVLLDQKTISGIGNYLRSEILWYSKISPHRLISSLNDKEIKLLYKNIIKMIWIYYNTTKALNKKKITKNDIKKIDRDDGFLVYMQKYDINGNKVKREKLGMRTIHWVQQHQK